MIDKKWRFPASVQYSSQLCQTREICFHRIVQICISFIGQIIQYFKELLACVIFYFALSSLTAFLTMRKFRRLAAYPGICHIRTVDGSSFKCDIQVSEDRRYDSNTIRAEYSLSVTRVDPEELDGLTYAEWISEEV